MPDILFEPLQFRNITIKNRILRSNISGRFDNYDGSGNQARINWELKFARGGVGAIVSSFVPVTIRGRILPNYATIDRDERIPFWRELARQVHEHDCRFIMQLSHGGRQRDIGGIEFEKGLSSTDKPDPAHGFECERMNAEQIQEAIAAFASGARRARQAGVDGVELHAANGYLFTQFLSSAINDRRDEYGGSLENRARFLLDVVRAIRTEVGSDFHLQVKISATEYNNALSVFEPAGNTIQDSVQVVKWLEAAGVDAIHVSSGSSFPHPKNPPGELPVKDMLKTYDSMLSSGKDTFRNYLLLRNPIASALYVQQWNRARGEVIEGINLPDSARIRQAVGIPVICTGGFQTASFIREAIQRGDCDGVSIARPLVANNDLAQMFAAGLDRAPKPCTYCNKCLVNVVENPLGCYEEARYDSRAEMIAQIMSVFEPAPFQDTEMPAHASGWKRDPGFEEEGIFDRVGQFFNRKKEWYDVPTILAVPQLVRMRDELRAKNLHDTEEPPMAKRDPNEPLPPGVTEERTHDGTYNDLGCPMMGATGRRFGRNIPLQHTFPDTANLMKPNPREVSRELMTRTEFQPASFLNLFAASWIQFMVHDWFVHKNSDGRVLDIPLPAGDDFPVNPMQVKATEVDPAPEGSTRPPAYANHNSHWWDGSQIYGSDAATVSKLRTRVDGKIKLSESGRLILDPETGLELTGFTDNGWIGLSMLHSLFAKEHNTVCDMLKQKYPDWQDDQLYAKARLINSAMLAKIHTIDWTPAIMPHPTTQLALRTNWSGILGEGLQEVLKFLDENELLGGIVGSHADHHTAPYSLTEEFVSVYRMHTLIPDDFVIRSHTTGEKVAEYTLPQVSGKNGCKVLDNHSFVDLFYSFGVSHPGAIRLHNFPKHLQDLQRDGGERFDLAAVDILRDRERGVPRYNEFRRQLRKDPVKSFEELTDVPAWREEIRKVYNNDLEQVDLMVGLFCEPLPKGFGFSETAFRIFVLMASRRLKSDRFFTDDFRPEVYTPEGIAWIKDNNFMSVLKRNYPELAPAWEGVENPFAPWKASSASELKRSTHRTA